MAENVITHKLTQRQRQALEALMTSPTIRQAARQVKVSERQLYRWLDDTAFTAALRHAEGEALAGAVRRLTSLASDAAEALSRALSDDTTTKNITVRAAEVILSRLVTLKEFSELEARIAAVEAALKVKQ